MSEETNIAVVQNAYEKFGTGDIPGLLTLLTDDIDWSTPHVENAPFAGNRLGLQEVGEFFKLLGESEEFSYFEPTEFIAQGNRVVVLGRSKATVKTTGRTYETDWVHLFTVHEGKITNFHEFFDNAAATRAFQKTAAA
ncbi:MAG: nuclear transport factor 2 family protein [Acidobacteriota bacterium]